MTMMPGRYYVGDLCYVMHNEWSEICNLTIQGQTILNGEFTLKNGVKIAMVSTEYGDGCYSDQYKNEYCVDSGSIGCIELTDITDEIGGEQIEELGSVFEFDKPFEVYSHKGTIYVAHVAIETAETYSEED